LIDGREYCSVSLWATYGALLLARSWGAHCLFDDHTFNYCRIKFGLSKYPQEAEPGRIEGFHSVFNAYLPNTSVFPDYVMYRIFSSEKCEECGRSKKCKDGYLADVEEKVKELITWRSYDEIIQLKDVLEDIVHQRNNGEGIINPSDIVGDFRAKEMKSKRRMKRGLPKIQRWANITTMLSVPVALFGAATGDQKTTIAG